MSAISEDEPSMASQSEAAGSEAAAGDSLPSQDARSKWLTAHHDPMANLNTVTECMSLSDLHGDGESKLVLADRGSGQKNMKLKVYRGTALMSENTIIDVPTAVVTFLLDTTEPRTPAVAVASGPYIYIYKNLRPYFKFTLPSLDINPTEYEVWGQARLDKISVSAMREMLEGLREEVGETQLSARTQHFLEVAADPAAAQDFVDQYKVGPLKRQTVITCLGTLKKNMQDEDAVSCLVVGTENRLMYVLDPEAFTILISCTLPAVPTLLSITGLFDVEYRLLVACRNAKIYTLKRGHQNIVKHTVDLGSHVIGMKRIGKNIVVGCMDSTLRCYTQKGKKMWSIHLPARVSTMEQLEYFPRNIKAVVVALDNREVHLYQDKFQIDSFVADDVVTGLKFGRFGREDGALGLVGKRGSLTIRILRRTATFHEKLPIFGPPVSQQSRLNVPKKTKMFVDQTMRERESSAVMHRTFQQDLYKLRLTTARAYVKSLNSAMNPVSARQNEKLWLSAEALGLGPVFKLIVHVKNVNDTLAIDNLVVAFDYDISWYKVDRAFVPLAFLVPQVEYKVEVTVTCVSEQAVADEMKVLVGKVGDPVPLITASINMPVSEPAM